MNNFITGLFTLLGVLGGIWLKNFLDNKKVSENTKREKAIEAYALTGKLMHSLTGLKVICSNLVQDRNYPYMDVYINNRDTSPDIVERLEQIIVSCFYDLTTRQQLLEIERAINSYGGFLSNIITTIHNQNFQLDSEAFKEKTDKFDQTLVQSCHNLRSTLVESYINITTPQVTFYTLLESAKQRTKLFFTK